MTGRTAGSGTGQALAGFGLDDFRRAVGRAAVHDPSVSGWSVGMHVHHCCRSMIGIGRLLAKSKPPPPARFPSLVGSVVLTFGRIPRGRAKAPDFAAPDPGITETELIALLDESERLLAAIPGLNRRAWFRHFILGVLTRDRAVRFVRIHNRHHLRIIEDIVAAAQGAHGGPPARPVAGGGSGS